MLKKIAVLAVFAAIFSLITFPAAAGTRDEYTVVTFSQPVELPGIVLPAGTYVVKLADIAWNRDIVQVFNEKETRLYATIVTMPASRMKASAETVMTFEERTANLPEALKTWFYAGELDGHSFVNPKAKVEEGTHAAD